MRSFRTGPVGLVFLLALAAGAGSAAAATPNFEAAPATAGPFTQVPAQATDHVLRIDAGVGHVAQVTSPAGNLPDGAPSAGEPAGNNSLADEAVAAAIRDAIRPLRQELSLYAARPSAPVVLGGIGYIVGLAGLAYLLMALRRRRQSAARDA